jgi:hypothetical protein
MSQDSKEEGGEGKRSGRSELFREKGIVLSYEAMHKDKRREGLWIREG